MACYERALALNPNLSSAYFNLANILFNQGRWDEAVAAYQNALKRGPCPLETYNRLGVALLAQSKAAEAIPYLERAVAAKPEGAIPPSAPRRARPFSPSALPDGYRPRGSTPATGTAHSELDRNRPPATDRRSRQHTAALPMLRSSNRETHAPETFLTQ